ncbi:hypothetical protein V1512DRAFT_208356 [Lipomyces arxii]|uniref:uncharacterized protein n=1 Tax=Lipomyces arxii TaxID=56418 RepID=UPI0034CE2355
MYIIQARGAKARKDTTPADADLQHDTDQKQQQQQSSWQTTAADAEPEQKAAKSQGKYSCVEVGCGKVFNQRTHLDIHGRSHTGSRPYVCDVPNCGKRFSQRGNLRTHKRCHTGERPYVCQFCDKRFAQRGNVRAHLLTHEDYRPYVCKLDGCVKSFTQLGNLKSHQNRFHASTLNVLAAKFQVYTADEYDESTIPADERDMFDYFAELYRNSNKGIKGRGKDSYKQIKPTIAVADQKSIPPSPAIEVVTSADPKAAASTPRGHFSPLRAFALYDSFKYKPTPPAFPLPPLTDPGAHMGPTGPPFGALGPSFF